MARKLVFISLCLLVLIIPFENLIIISGIGTISRFAGAFCFVMAVFSLIIEKKWRPLGIMQVAFGIFVLWSMTTFFWSVDYEESRKAIVTLIQLFVFVWLIWEFAREEEHQLWLLRAYVYGALVSSLLTFSAFWHGESASYLRYSTPGFNPNDLGLTLALGVPMAWCIAVKEKGFCSRQVYRLYLPFSFFAVILTASRTSFIAMLSGYVFVMWTFKYFSLFKRAILWCGFVSIGLGLIHFLPDSSWSRLVTIGHELNSGTLGGRVAIWRDGLQIFSENPLFGVGVGAFRSELGIHYGYEAASHNLFLSVLVGQGLIGFLLLCFVLFSAIWGVGSLSPLVRWMWFGVLLVWGIGVMTLSWELRKPTWMILGLLASMVGNRSKETIQLIKD